MNQRFNFDEEIRCDYKVSSNRKKLWACELDMLDILDKICNELNIQYFLIFGSALGAVRHDGFIPWDDDIDIGMIREDFEIFRKEGCRLLPEYIGNQYGVSKHGVDTVLRLRDSRTTGITYLELKRPGNKGAFIELYPFDHVKNVYLRDIQVFFTDKCVRLMRKIEAKMEINDNNKLICLKMIWKLYETVCKLQNRFSCKYVDTIALPGYTTKREDLFEEKYVSKTIIHKFENTKVRLPMGNDICLTQQYGNYMKFPPVEERGTFHENIVFYDPNVSYKEYLNSDIPKRYFEGDNDLNLL